MVIRVRFAKFGAHFHCRVFTAKRKNQSFGKCGDLTFDEREWPEVREILESRSIEVLPEDSSDA